MLYEEVKDHSRHLKRLTKQAAPQLVETVGIGYDIAAEMLTTAGDNGNRVKSEAAFAKMCGACPIPAGSGKTNGRHRLYRGGNRQANAALYRAVNYSPDRLALYRSINAMTESFWGRMRTELLNRQRWNSVIARSSP